MYGKMTLEELREYFKKDHEAFRILQEKALSKRDREISDELDQVKREHYMSKINEVDQEKDMEEIMKLMETKKENEFRAKIEKEKIEAELKALERTKLGYMEQEKKRELQRLAREREDLQKREDDLMNQIEDLSSKKQEHQEYEESKNSYREPNQADILKKREMDLAKERAVKIAEIK